jgi:hypothetical protein
MIRIRHEHPALLAAVLAILLGSANTAQASHKEWLSCQDDVHPAPATIYIYDDGAKQLYRYSVAQQEIYQDTQFNWTVTPRYFLGTIPLHKFTYCSSLCANTGEAVIVDDMDKVNLSIDRVSGKFRSVGDPLDRDTIAAMTGLCSPIAPQPIGQLKRKF